MHPHFMTNLIKQEKQVFLPVLYSMFFKCTYFKLHVSFYNAHKTECTHNMQWLR